jgi:hypothetical protein
MRDTFTSGKRSAGALDCCCCFGRDFFLFHGRGGDGTHPGIKHGLKKADNSRELGWRKLIDQLVGLLLFVAGIGCHDNFSKLWLCRYK